jgi:uncharacterized membrane protein
MRWLRAGLDGMGRHPGLVVLGAAAVALAWIGHLLLLSDEGLTAPAYDLAFFQQVVWNLGHTNGFVNSFHDYNFLGEHFEPILLLPALLELAWPDFRLLSLLHAVALAGSAPAAYLFIRACLPPSRAAAWLAAALAAPLPFWAQMQEAARSNFHPEALSLPLALLAGWAGVRGRPWALWILAGLALLAKEDQVYTVAAIAVAVYFLGPVAMRVQARLLAVAAVAVGALLFLAVMPILRGANSAEIHTYYFWLLTAGPLDVVQALVRVKPWLAVAGMLISLAGLPLLRPAWLLLLLPPLMAEMLSHHIPMPDLELHYSLLLMVPMLVAGAAGARAFLERRSPGRLALLATALPALAIGIALGRLPPAAAADWSLYDRAPALAHLRSITSVIPASAAVSADDSVAVAVASRPELHLVPVASESAYVVLERNGHTPGYVDVMGRDAMLAALPTSGRTLLVDDGRFQIWGP